ncbi:hypothetical protein SNE40_002810 [Patella caerulea]|uniref:Uncharacterized protein n=1 Tax=Patella caerulea TaxID=87958 RepID=A0AAN8K6W9_PATCE
MSDHLWIFLSLDFERPVEPPQLVTCRNIRGISVLDFGKDLTESELLENPPEDLYQLTAVFFTTLTKLMDKHAPKV